MAEHRNISGRDNLQLCLTTLHRNTSGLCTLAQGSPISQALTSLYRDNPTYWLQPNKPMRETLVPGRELQTQPWLPYALLRDWRPSMSPPRITYSAIFIHTFPSPLRISMRNIAGSEYETKTKSKHWKRINEIGNENSSKPQFETQSNHNRTRNKKRNKSWSETKNRNEVNITRIQNQNKKQIKHKSKPKPNWK